MDPGERLKLVRTKLGITTREVALFSKLIADAERNNEFLVSGPWLTQIENEKTSLPSIYKLFTLASIYGLSYSNLLAFNILICAIGYMVLLDSTTTHSIHS